MDRLEALQEIRELQEAGQPKAVIIRVLEQEGIPKSSAYRWLAQANNTDEHGNTPRDLAIQATLRVLAYAEEIQDHEFVLKSAMTLAKL